ncbi:MAG: hypothetical protein R3189_04665 [Thiomicrorhabdus chilensis]|uniref:hypothetical protein n=1 Tax=Thiomicrorhabdus chilensis TaxID=63656 RepID=UPI0003FE6181|nr:hypothetical protein [Thiomicrorhabdus chilensis]MDX1347527.1 hypothetical protein [Thiomicrorhabdus chilensis]
MHKTQDLIAEIKRLEAELLLEIQKQEETFFYKTKGRKIVFDEATVTKQKSEATGMIAYLLDVPILNFLTFPIIWFGIFPAMFMDLVVSLYHSICFRVYGIPLVKRSDYIVIDRHSLRYLNVIERLNCIYCGYFNGLMAYVQEISARTEQYWCPIKHARKLTSMHKHYHKFVAFGDYENYQNKLVKIRKDFEGLQAKPEKKKHKPT